MSFVSNTRPSSVQCIRSRAIGRTETVQTVQAVQLGLAPYHLPQFKSFKLFKKLENVPGVFSWLITQRDRNPGGILRASPYLEWFVETRPSKWFLADQSRRFRHRLHWVDR